MWSSFKGGTFKQIWMKQILLHIQALAFKKFKFRLDLIIAYIAI